MHSPRSLGSQALAFGALQIGKSMTESRHFPIRCKLQITGALNKIKSDFLAVSAQGHLTDPLMGNVKRFPRLPNWSKAMEWKEDE